jgi:large subunit ribosomal protein L32
MVIRMRHTRSHTANRRSHHALTAPNLAECKNCGSQHRPHHMCLNCGFYKGRVVIDLLAKKKDREARMTAKREMRKGQQSETPAEAEAKQSPSGLCGFLPLMRSHEMVHCTQ